MTDRAVSDVIGYVLVFSLVAVTVAVVSLAGVSALQDARNFEQVNNAERAFDVLADNVEDLYTEGVPSRATEMSLAGASVTTSPTATINVTGRTAGTTDFAVERTSNVVTWAASGGSDTRIVYAFGTVLRSGPDGGTVARAGPFQFDTDRTILPIVHTRTREGQRLTGGTIRIRGARSVPSLVYRGDATSIGTLWVNVTTAHPDTWAAYLDGREGTSCSVVEGPAGPTDRVECDLDPRTELYVTVHPIDVALER